jgi:hypothetical protein
VLGQVKRAGRPRAGKRGYFRARDSCPILGLVAAPQQKTADYFGTFLDALKNQEETSPAPNDQLAAILRALTAGGDQPIWELQKSTGLPFGDFINQVQAAQTSGFVEVSGASGDERVALTASGRELASRL